MKTNFRSLTFILLTCLVFPLPAQEEEEVRYYDIELIIFENIAPTPENTTPEVWKKSAELLVPEEKIMLGYPLELELDPKYDPAVSFKLLNAEELLLKEELDLLKEKEEYRILLHTGWRQPGMPRGKALNVYFKHAIGKNAADSENPENPENSSTMFNPVEAIPSVDQPVPLDHASTAPVTPDSSAAATPGLTEISDSEELTADATGAEEDDARPGFNQPLSHIQGIIKIILSRYLHTDIELLYRKTSDNQSIDRFASEYLEDRQALDVVYYLKQNRRMRSKELHYIDHPVMGVLVKIMPYAYVKPEEVIEPLPNGVPATGKPAAPANKVPAKAPG